MPQGILITVKPDKGMSDKDMKEKKCRGTVRVIDGEYKDKIGEYSAKNGCCDKLPGSEVSLDILSNDHGKLKVKLKDC